MFTFKFKTIFSPFSIFMLFVLSLRLLLTEIDLSGSLLPFARILIWIESSLSTWLLWLQSSRAPSTGITWIRRHVFCYLWCTIRNNIQQHKKLLSWMKKYEKCETNRRFIKLHLVPNVVPHPTGHSRGYNHVCTDREVVPIGGYPLLLLENILLLWIAIITKKKNSIFAYWKIYKN